MKNKIEVSGKPTVIPAYKMNVGDFGIVQKGSDSFKRYIGHTVLFAYGNIISLTEPRSTWDKPNATWPDFEVLMLPEGTEIKITVGGSNE